MSLTITDLFCGAGGSSLGAELAGAKLRLGLNHWDRAIETHSKNFQHADHDCEDVSSLTTAQIRRYPASDILLASPECVNHSLAKGARRRKPKAPSLWEDGPAGDAEQDRSRATMWDVVRFAEQKLMQGHPYKGIVVENVPDAFKWGYEDNGGLFQAWLGAMTALGYEHEIVWLNSMFCPPTPQSRDRMYVVFWKKGIRRPNLRVEPPSWCPHCERVVNGQQVWKRPDRPLHKPNGMPTGANYGANGQYLYACPECHHIVIPGVFPAATAIDWDLPAELIGDRKKPLAASTRERIRRGLERLALEPFAIRLLQGGVPRPLTLPLVTLTRRHDVGIVLPTSGNLFERTPGNRARRVDLQPADVVCQTGDRGLVLPPMGKVDARDVATDPSPTQTTTTRPSLVLSNRANNVPRIAGEQPTHPVLTGEHLGVVELQNHGGVRDPSEPLHTVRAGGNHHAVVLRNNGGDKTGWASTPTHEPLRTLTGRCHQSIVFPYGSEPHGPEEPARTLTTHDRLALLVPAGGSWRRDATPAHEPAPTLTGTESTAVAWGDGDIDACRFRMFALHEIAATMVMHDHVDGSAYVVFGNKREQMAQYGGAVTPPVMELLVSRLAEVL